MLLKYLLEPAIKKCKSYNIIKAHLILEAWDKTVGDKISKVSEAVFFKNNTLSVNVSTSSWLYELTLLKPEIIKKLNAALNKNIIKDIRFSSAQINKNAAKTCRDMPPRDKNIELSPEQFAQIEDNIKEIKDEKLKNITRNILVQEQKNIILKKELGYKNCSSCGVLINNKNSLCPFCAAEKFKKTENEVLKILSGKPWSTYEEIKKLAGGVSKEKYDLIKVNLLEKYHNKIAPLIKKKKLNAGDLNILLNLVMLKTELPLEKLNYKMCEKILRPNLSEHLKQIFEA